MYDPMRQHRASVRNYWIRCKRHKNDYVGYDEDGRLYMRLSPEAREFLAELIAAEIDKSARKK